MKSTGRNSFMPVSKLWFSEPVFMKLKLVNHLYITVIPNFMKIQQMV